MRSFVDQARTQLRFAMGLALRRPFDVCLQVTNRCNMRCDFCHFWSMENDVEQELTVAEYRRLSRELADLGCFLVSIEGGEPLLRPDLPEIVEAFARYHLPVIYTNGWFVDSSRAEELFAAGLTQVGVSIDYPDAARHDGRRGPAGAFDRAWGAVDALRDAAPFGGAQVHVMTILMQDNQDEIEAMLQLSQSHDVGHHITLISPHRVAERESGRYWPTQPLSEQLLRFHSEYKHFATFREYLGLVDTFVAGEAMPACTVGRQMFNIGATGDVTPCNEKLNWVAGNVRQASLPQLHERLREMQEIGTCQDCWLLCRGFSHVLGAGGSLKGWVDLSTRMSSR